MFAAPAPPVSWTLIVSFVMAVGTTGVPPMVTVAPAAKHRPLMRMRTAADRTLRGLGFYAGHCRRGERDRGVELVLLRGGRSEIVPHHDGCETGGVHGRRGGDLRRRVHDHRGGGRDTKKDSRRGSKYFPVMTTCSPPIARALVGDAPVTWST